MPDIKGTTRAQTIFLRAFRDNPLGPPPDAWPTPAVLDRGERVHEEVQISAPGGETRHLLVSQEPLRDAAGAIVGLTGAATDITEQKRAQEQLARALVFREQVMAVLGDR